MKTAPDEVCFHSEVVFESLTMLATLLMMCFPAGSPTGSMPDAVQ